MLVFFFWHYVLFCFLFCIFFSFWRLSKELQACVFTTTGSSGKVGFIFSKLFVLLKFWIVRGKTKHLFAIGIVYRRKNAREHIELFPLTLSASYLRFAHDTVKKVCVCTIFLFFFFFLFWKVLLCASISVAIDEEKQADTTPHRHTCVEKQTETTAFLLAPWCVYVLRVFFPVF